MLCAVVNRDIHCGTGGLVGRLLPRVLLREQGISLDRMTFARTDSGKPYIASAIHTLVVDSWTERPRLCV